MPTISSDLQATADGTVPPVWIIGAGGHSRVVIDAVRAMGRFRLVGVLDDNPACWDETAQGVLIQGPASPERITELGIERAVLAVGDNWARAQLAHELGTVLAWETVIHPFSYVASDVEVGAGTVVMAGAVVQPGTRIGRHTILNTACSADHDSLLGDFVHLAPGVRLCGNVTIGEGSLCGAGSIVLPKCSVGAWATVGAGAVVARDIPAGVTAKGIPARW